MSINTLVSGIEMMEENYETQKQFIFHKVPNDRKVSILSNQQWDSETDLVMAVRGWLQAEGLNPPNCLGIRVLKEKGWAQLWFDRQDYRQIGYDWFNKLRSRNDLILISSNGHPAWYVSFMMKKEVRRLPEMDDEMSQIFSGKKKVEDGPVRTVRNVSRRNVRQSDVELDLEELDEENPF